MGKKILGIIPARGGSKMIPDKNIVNICGKPLIAYTIDEAKKSRYIDKAIVSTDSEKIKNTALKYGGEVPFLRPKHLAEDTSKSIDAVIHAIDFLMENGMEYDYVVFLQPTSPLRKVEDIDNALELIIKSNADSLTSVREVSENPIIMRTIKENKLKEILHFEGSLRRQDLPKFYILNGALYINKVSMLVNEKIFVNEDTIPYIMPGSRSIDIDEPLDLKIAELVMKENGYV